MGILGGFAVSFGANIKAGSLSLNKRPLNNLHIPASILQLQKQGESG